MQKTYRNIFVGTHDNNGRGDDAPIEAQTIDFSVVMTLWKKVCEVCCQNPDLGVINFETVELSSDDDSLHEALDTVRDFGIDQECSSLSFALVEAIITALRTTSMFNLYQWLWDGDIFAPDDTETISVCIDGEAEARMMIYDHYHTR